jgi:glucose-1-phosphate cytidylyltransferase
LADTGDRTMTGGRIARAAKYLKDSDEEFFLTYGDAVADVDISVLLKQHRLSGKMLTITAVHPAGRFGEMNIINGAVVRFAEKPQTEDGFINGGFMVMNKCAVNKYLSTASELIFEQKPVNAILADKEMQAYKHEGFWQCMDTPREHALLNELWDSGKAPWTKNW